MSGVDLDEVRKLRANFLFWKILFVIGGLLLAVVSFIIGYLIGKSRGESGGSAYPYCSIGLLTLPAAKDPRLLTRLLLLLSASSFIAGLSSPVFGQSVDYGVYEKPLGMDE